MSLFLVNYISSYVYGDTPKQLADATGSIHDPGAEESGAAEQSVAAEQPVAAEESGAAQDDPSIVIVCDTPSQDADAAEATNAGSTFEDTMKIITLSAPRLSEKQRQNPEEDGAAPNDARKGQNPSSKVEGDSQQTTEGDVPPELVVDKAEERYRKTGNEMKKWDTNKLIEAVKAHVKESWGPETSIMNRIGYYGSALSTILSAILNLWYLMDTAVALDRDSSQHYNLTQWVVVLIEVAVVYASAIWALMWLILIFRDDAFEETLVEFTFGVQRVCSMHLSYFL